MKIIEANINDIDNIGETLKAIIKSQYLKEIITDLVEDERYHNPYGLMFLVGVHRGSALASAEMGPFDTVAQVAASDFSLATEAADKLGDEDFIEYYIDLGRARHDALKKIAEEDRCDCPECRAKREAEKEA